MQKVQHLQRSCVYKIFFYYNEHELETKYEIWGQTNENF